MYIDSVIKKYKIDIVLSRKSLSTKECELLKL